MQKPIAKDWKPSVHNQHLEYSKSLQLYWHARTKVAGTREELLRKGWVFS